MQMAILPRPSSPIGAIRDFIDFVRAPRKHKLLFFFVSLLFPLGLFAALLQQAKVDADYVPPKIVYFQQWPADRTVVQVRAQQAKDLPAELARKKEREAAAERTKQAYRKIADALNIDVDEKPR
jgi:hypothetical protein